VAAAIFSAVNPVLPSQDVPYFNFAAATFWSITVYDTKRGGFLHPNDDDRYHINNTTATKNADGQVIFTFKQSCGDDDLNCLEVPAGPFDLAARYYLPSEAIISGEWTLPKAELQK